MHCPSGYIYPSEIGCQASGRRSNDRVTYQNSAQIQAWAVNTIGSPVDDTEDLDIQSREMFPNDGPWSSGAPPMPGYLTRTNSNNGSDTWNAAPMQRSNDLMANGRPIVTANAYGVQPGNNAEFAMTRGLGFEMPANSNGDNCMADFNYPMIRQPYPSPTEDGVACAFPPNDETFLSGAADCAMDTCPGWPAPSDTQEMNAGPIDDAYSNGWNEASVDLSVSSSLSSQDPATPLSLSQDAWEDTSLGTHHPLVTASNHLMPSVGPLPDTQSTVRPAQGSQRNPLPEHWMQSPPDAAGQAFGSPISMFTSSRRSSEGEPLSARRDPRYQLKPGNNGLYQCVFVEDGKACEHEPFKLKCNYDKHLDSHLKPYRCKQSGCAENPFSSTACLLRHEREAHGMHNHKEVLCVVKDCERSFPGRGFPRKWNAHDHMKRVHRYTPPEDSNSGEASSPSTSSIDLPCSVSSAVRTGRRRITTSTEYPGARKTKASSGKSMKAIGRAQFSQENSPGQVFMEQDVYSEVSKDGANWTSWLQYRTVEDQGQPFNHME